MPSANLSVGCTVWRFSPNGLNEALEEEIFTSVSLFSQLFVGARQL